VVLSGSCIDSVLLTLHDVVSPDRGIGIGIGHGRLHVARRSGSPGGRRQARGLCILKRGVASYDCINHGNSRVGVHQLLSLESTPCRCAEGSLHDGTTTRRHRPAAATSTALRGVRPSSASTTPCSIAHLLVVGSKRRSERCLSHTQYRGSNRGAIRTSTTSGATKISGRGSVNSSASTGCCADSNANSSWSSGTSNATSSGTVSTDCCLATRGCTRSSSS
jgi:hypothetical protein